MNKVYFLNYNRTFQEGQNPLPLRLRAVNVPVVDYFRCKMAYPRILTRNMVCVGNFVLGGQGTCQVWS